MANNRMYLVYKPTGRAVFLGKRMGQEWYGAPENLGALVETLFDLSAEEDVWSDSYELVFEETGAIDYKLLVIAPSAENRAPSLIQRGARFLRRKG
jgi:hypothetical protein